LIQTPNSRFSWRAGGCPLEKSSARDMRQVRASSLSRGQYRFATWALPIPKTKPYKLFIQLFVIAQEDPGFKEWLTVVRAFDLVPNCKNIALVSLQSSEQSRTKLDAAIFKRGS
jgi:hypothetical protein